MASNQESLQKDRCTSHVHGPCDCGYQEFLELIENSDV